MPKNEKIMNEFVSRLDEFRSAVESRVHAELDSNSDDDALGELNAEEQAWGAIITFVRKQGF